MPTLRLLLTSALILLQSMSHAADSLPVYPDLMVNTSPTQDGFNINGGFTVPLSQCQSYHLLTDYDLEQEMPGVKMIKHTRLSGRRVQLQRELEERVLFLPVQISSVIEITEKPYRGMDFVQISGSAKSYTGQWRLHTVENGTRFVYKAHTEPGTLFPDAIARQVVEDSLRKNFTAMVEIAHRRLSSLNNQCT